MQVIIAKCLYLSFIITVASTTVPEKTQYTTKYDNVDLEDVLKSDRLLKNYVDCLLELKPCTPDGLELRKNMPDAFETDCSKCSEKQRDGSEKIIRFLIDHKPEYFKPLQDKFDPTGSYMKRYLESKSDVNAEPVKNK